MADPHTDLPDRLDEMANRSEVHRVYGVMPTLRKWDADSLRAAAAELRRLRHRDAALIRLLDAVGDAHTLRYLATYIYQHDPHRSPTAPQVLRRIAAAVEGIDQEHER